MLADGFPQQLERRAFAGFTTARIHFLQRHDIRIVARNHLNDAIERKLAIRPDAAMDIPRHDPNGRLRPCAQARNLRERIRRA